MQRVRVPAPRRTLALALAGAVVVLVVAVLWLSGGFSDLVALAMALQRQFQNQMAAALRLLKQGDPGAAAALMVLCFGYGFLHAAGPGHGKFLISGYGFATGARLWPLMAIALAASVAQASVAVVMVYAGVALLSLTRDQLVATADQTLVTVSAAAMGLIGLWLLARGAAGVWRQVRPGGGRARHRADQGKPMVQGDEDHHHHDQDGNCDRCGHSHGPTVEQMARVIGWRDGAMLVGAVALRPCSGALFLLVLTWQMGIGLSGIAGAYVMALGTALVGVSVAVLAFVARGSAMELADRLGWLRIAAPLAELAVGAGVALFALNMLAL